MGVVPPAPEFLQALRRLTEEHGILLIFDEVISGFRVTYGGAQTLYGIKPDLTVLGKIIGGGLPVGAYGGRKEIMDLIAPLGPVYQAGTLSGNPLAVSAGIETLKQIEGPWGLQEAGRKVFRLGQRDWRGCEKSRRAAHANQSRLDTWGFFCGRPGGGLEYRETVGHEAIREILSRDAGTGGVSGPLSIRSRLPLNRTFIPRYRHTIKAAHCRIQEPLITIAQ